MPARTYSASLASTIEIDKRSGLTRVESLGGTYLPVQSTLRLATASMYLIVSRRDSTHTVLDVGTVDDVISFVSSFGTEGVIEGLSEGAGYTGIGAILNEATGTSRLEAVAIVYLLGSLLGEEEEEEEDEGREVGEGEGEEEGEGEVVDATQ